MVQLSWGMTQPFYIHDRTDHLEKMRTLVRTEGIITQLVFEHALRVRMKAESSDGDTTAVPTPDNASVANAESASGDLSRASLASEQLLTQGKSVAQEFESQADASESNDSASGNLTGKINNLVTTDMGNITDARDFLLLGMCHLLC